MPVFPLSPARVRWSLLFLLLALGAQGEKPEIKTEKAGRIVSIAGTVLVNGHPAKVGDTLKDGDVIHTEIGSSTKLLLSDQSVLDISESSNLTLTRARTAKDGSRDVDATLDLGAVRAAVGKKLDKKSKFYIRTRSSVLSVRGTEFIAIDGIDEERTVVLEGQVDRLRQSGQGEPVAIPAGHQFLIVGITPENRAQLGEGSGESNVRPLSPGELASLGDAYRNPDTTFSRSLSTDALANPSHGGDRTVASLSETMRNRMGAAGEFAAREIASAIGQDAASAIPNYAGPPATNLRAPSPSPRDFQVPMAVKVIYVP